MSTGTRDDETLYEPCAQEALYRVPAVDIQMAGTRSSKPRDDLLRWAAHLLMLPPRAAAPDRSTVAMNSS